MIFNSSTFLIFFFIVYSVYRILPHNSRNYFLLMASYIFYGWWDFRFLGLLWIVTAISFFCAQKIQSGNEREKRRYLKAGLFLNLGILGLFKYYNFFEENLILLLREMGWGPPLISLKIILPAGLSFYMFQSMGYIIDVYRGGVKATRDFFKFSLFLGFFPLLVSGPIERAGHMFPQIENQRTLLPEKTNEGIWLIVWGFYKKIFIADNLSRIIDAVFGGGGHLAGGEALLGLYALAFRIYCDFSGYSDIARGIAKLLGFEIVLNFDAPFFSPNIQVFWNRWHMSLSFWIRDYLYTPLFLAVRFLKTPLRLYLTTMIAMLCVGVWHGANWNYFFYGIYHGVLLCLYAAFRPFMQRIVNPKGKYTSLLWYWARIIFTFQFTALGFLFFQETSLNKITRILEALLHFKMSPLSWVYLSQLIFFVFPLLLFEIYEKRKKLETPAPAAFCLPIWLKVPFYSLIAWSVLIFGNLRGQQFIYFQF